jgi:CRISPR/Cas system-associated protein Csm6
MYNMYIIDCDFNAQINFAKDGVLKDVTNLGEDDLHKLNIENDKMRSDIETQYIKARKLLSVAEQDGHDISICLYKELEDLRKDNQEKVYKLETLLSQFDTTTNDNKAMVEQLDSKVKRVQHLEAYLVNFESVMQDKGDMLYSGLCKKRQQNTDSQVTLLELQNEVK